MLSSRDVEIKVQINAKVMESFIRFFNLVFLVYILPEGGESFLVTFIHKCPVQNNFVDCIHP